LLQNTAQVTGCTPPTGRYISDVATADGTRTTNYGANGSAADLGSELQCIAEVGTSGCGFLAPLEAMKLSLDGSNPENAGFLRADADLAVIMLTDADDLSVQNDAVFDANLTSTFPVQADAYQCEPTISTTAPGTYANCTVTSGSYLRDPAYYAAFLASIKDPSQTVVAVISGPPPGVTTNDVPPQRCQMCGPQDNDISTGPLTIPGRPGLLAILPSCSATINGNPTNANPAIRLGDFVANIGANHGYFYSVCQSDYTAALAGIAGVLFNTMSSCLEGAIDTSDRDPTNPGTQLTCTVADVVDLGTASETSTLIPACTMADARTPDPNQTFPCWWADMNTTQCIAPDTGYEVVVDRNGQSPPTGTVVQVTCAGAPPTSG
jgi:hypothetical protein